MALPLTADLHTHSRHSDGSLTPGELRSLARERGVGLLSITDHDTVAAYAGDDLPDRSRRGLGSLRRPARQPYCV